MKQIILFSFLLLLTRGSTYAQTDSIYFEASGVIVKKSLVSEIDWITFERISPLQISIKNESQDNLQPMQFNLSQNYPNPFNPMTKFICNIPSTGEMQVKIFDIRGSLINEIFSGVKNKGEHIFTWDGKNSKNAQVATGTYLVCVRYNNSLLTKKIIYLK